MTLVSYVVEARDVQDGDMLLVGSFDGLGGSFLSRANKIHHTEVERGHGVGEQICLWFSSVNRMEHLGEVFWEVPDRALDPRDKVVVFR